MWKISEKVSILAGSTNGRKAPHRSILGYFSPTIPYTEAFWVVFRLQSPTRKHFGVFFRLQSLTRKHFGFLFACNPPHRSISGYFLPAIPHKEAFWVLFCLQSPTRVYWDGLVRSRKVGLLWKV